MKNKLAKAEVMEAETLIVTRINPKRRDEFGLWSHIDHEYDEYGFVNWKAMIPKKDISLNRESYLKKSEPIDIDVLSEEELEILKNKAKDTDLVIKISGYKHLAFLRGYLSLKTHSQYVTETKCVSTCEITWIPNFETGGRPVTTNGVADACPENTNVLSTKYLTAISENRAFCRCVRNFLRINILGKDELKFDTVDDVGERLEIPMKNLTGPLAVLDKKLKDKKKSFADFHQYILSNYSVSDFPGADTWEKIGDIPIPLANLLLDTVSGFLASKA